MSKHSRAIVAFLAGLAGLAGITVIVSVALAAADCVKVAQVQGGA